MAKKVMNKEKVKEDIVEDEDTGWVSGDDDWETHLEDTD